jgi:hypothetical protein
MIGYGDPTVLYDFFAYNAAGQVWNGSSFVAWADGNYTTYRIAASQVGTSGKFVATAPSGMAHYEMRERAVTLAASYPVWAVSDVVASIKSDPELGTSGLVADASTAATESIAANDLLESDKVLILSGGEYVLETRLRGTTTKLIPDKVAKLPGGTTNLTNPNTQELGGYIQP